MGSGGISEHRQPSLAPGVNGLGGTVGAMAVAALLAIGVAAVAAVGAAGDRPRARAGLSRVAFGVQLHHYPSAENRVVLSAAHPARPASHPSAPGRPMRWWAASIARWRSAWGLRAGIPSP